MYPTTTLPARQKMKPAASKPDLLRCYNCSGIGHLSAACKEPRRAKGSCFRCGSTQHQLKECPKPSPRNNSQVALADEFHQNANGDRSSAGAGELGAALSELNIYSRGRTVVRDIGSVLVVLDILPPRHNNHGNSNHHQQHQRRHQQQ
ncbi:uncharacterized protein LOC135709582 [Ochlerotatus camptorhynchus]|uniref:uncharacterized protein LOC135709582 n=1 Tax=Ochlerotatus camptorhynchus TaxID=644619 RepID=UPI0031DE8A73